MESPQDNVNLFQQIGHIQGTLNALIASLAGFQTEFRTATNDQNKKIEDLRKEVGEEISKLSTKVETLEQFKANLEGARSEAKKNAQWSGGITGATAGAIILALIKLAEYLATK